MAAVAPRWRRHRDGRFDAVLSHLHSFSLGFPPVFPPVFPSGLPWGAVAAAAPTPVLPAAAAAAPLSTLELAALLMERGGIVMWPLLALSVIALTLILERAWFWIGMHAPGRVRRFDRLVGALRTGRRDEAQRLLRGDGSVYAAVAGRLLDDGATDAVVLEAVELQRPRLDRFMATLSTIITAAPMIGILGTVLGIIRSFRLLGMDARLADPLQVSGGIAEALITTAAGLVVVLCTLFPFMVFRAQVDRSISRLEVLVAAARQGREKG